jgi:hypothetical protein
MMTAFAAVLASSCQVLADRLAGLNEISAKCWSEWQDLNLRPPRPERALPKSSMFIGNFGSASGRLFSFGCVISVGFLSGSEGVHGVLLVIRVMDAHIPARRFP